MNTADNPSADNPSADNPAAQHKTPAPLPYRQRRILGVLMEKARTTPDAYPLSLNGIVTGCNQKSNRHPTMDLSPEQVEDELEKMRAAGIVAEIQGGSRVAKYRHFGYDYMGVKGAEAAIMTELLLRGEQTVGELRTRASRFEPIADLATLQGLLDSLRNRGLVVALTPTGRGQLITHNLYLPEELARLKQLSGSQTDLAPQPAHVAALVAAPANPTQQPAPTVLHAPPAALSSTAAMPPLAATDIADLAIQVELLSEELTELRHLVEKLSDRLERLES